MHEMYASSVAQLFTVSLLQCRILMKIYIPVNDHNENTHVPVNEVHIEIDARDKIQYFSVISMYWYDIFFNLMQITKKKVFLINIYINRKYDRSSIRKSL